MIMIIELYAGQRRRHAVRCENEAEWPGSKLGVEEFVVQQQQNKYQDLPYCGDDEVR